MIGVPACKLKANVWREMCLTGGFLVFRITPLLNFAGKDAVNENFFRQTA
jgi:hypothetical protein